MDSEKKPGTEAGIDRGRLKRAVAIRVVLVFLIMGAAFFGTAGTFRYWQAWAYLGALLVPFLFVITYLYQRDPALLERRMRMKEKEREQKLIIKISWVFFLAAYLLPGFDRRFGWSSLPPAVVIAADLAVLLSYVWIARVFRENSFASRVVEVERAQKVIDTGPYRWVRHPMYSGVLVFYLVGPLALGSPWAFLPALGIVPIIVLRALNEEKVLAAELAGYREYMNKVRFRLYPGVW
jgi:protein-S-isoprenylcysteine O-methyltransferase Ste14